VDPEGVGGGIPPGLLARLDDLWFENYAAWARSHPLGSVHQAGGWRIASLGSPWPFYNVATAVEGEDPDPSRLREVLGRVGGYRVWLRDGMEVAESALLAAGYSSELEIAAYLLPMTAVATPPMSGGAARPSPLAPPSAAAAETLGPAGYLLSRAREREEVAEGVWGDLRSPWLGVDDATVTFPDPWTMAQNADRRFYQARQGGRLVATGQSLFHGGLLGVYGMWTDEAHRSMGLATGLLQLILEDGANAGADYATLQAAHPGGGLYAAAGFRQRYTYRVYRDRL
jgi:ribosomal protein S18 acetylase RimI-like enzyme